MNKLLLSIVAVSTLSAGLTGCGFRDDVTVVDKDSSVGYVARDSRDVREVRTVRPARAAVLTGRMASDQHRLIFRKKGIVVHDGYSYRLDDRYRYVLVR